jgi:hypothetical protein
LARDLLRKAFANLFMHALKALWPGSTIKRWLGSQPSEAKPVATPPPVPAKPQAPTPVARVNTPVARSSAPQPAPIVQLTGDDKFLHLPLKPIFERLSPALKGLAIADHEVSDTDEIALQIDNILAQLPGGVVRISFGELRHAAPVGIFGEQNSHDYTLIDVPLSEILARINPARLLLRADRKHVEVPAEVPGVFGKDGASTVTIAPIEPVKKAARDVAPAQPKHAPQAPVAKTPTPPQRARVVIPPAPPGGDIIQFTRATTPAPSAPTAEPSAMPMPPRVHVKPATPVEPVAPADEPVFQSSAPIAMPTIAKQAPAPAVAAAPAKPEVPSEPLIVPIGSLADFWQSAIKAEIDQARPAIASLAIPLARLEAPMKTGKLNFRWSELRQWMKPTPLLGTSAHAESDIQLPLNVIAPLFFAHPTRAQTAKKKAEIAQDIPDVFGSNSAAEAIRELANVPVAKVTPQAAPPAPVALPPVAPAVAAQGNGATNMQLRMAGATNGNGNGTHAPAESPVLFARNSVGANAVVAANGNGHAATAQANGNGLPKIDWTPDQAV